MNLNELTAEQLVFLNTVNDILVETYERVIREKGISRNIEIPMMGTIKSFHRIPDEEIDEIKKNTRYLFAKSIQDKLKPIADFIKEATPEVYDSAFALADMSEEVETTDDNS